MAMITKSEDLTRPQVVGVRLGAEFLAGTIRTLGNIQSLPDRVIVLADQAIRLQEGLDTTEARLALSVDLHRRALAIIADAIVHGMPVTEEVANVRNEIAALIGEAE